MNKTKPQDWGNEIKQPHYNNIHEQEQKAEAQIQADQLGSPPIIPDSKRRRYTVAGDKPKSKNGWIQCFIDINGVLVCHYGSWRTGQSCTFIGNRCNAKPLTPAERRALAKHMQQQKQERKKAEKQAQLETRKEAQSLWKQADKLHIEHSYLVVKQVQAFGLGKLKHQILIPMRDSHGILWNCQRIYPSGRKCYLKNGRILGLYHTIGTPENNEQCIIYICEGYATGASIHQKTGKTVIIAFSTANLIPVAIVIKRKFPQARIILACDNDRFTKGNPGISYGRKASEVIHAEYIYPKFPPECTIGTDFNDLINWEAEHGKS